MEITESTIYWITRLDCLCTIINTVGVLSIVFSLFLGICTLCAWGDTHYLREDAKTVKIFLTFTFISFFFGLMVLITRPFVPTTKEMCAIKVIPAIANNENFKGLSNQVYELGKEWLDELRPLSVKGKDSTSK